MKCAGVDAESTVAATVRREEFEIGSEMRGGIGRLVRSDYPHPMAPPYRYTGRVVFRVEIAYSP